MSNLNWKVLIDNGDLTICPFEEAQAKNVDPNRLAWLKDSKLGALVVFQLNRGDDFAIGKNGLDYLTNAKKEGRITDGFVLLVRKNGSDSKPEFVSAATVEEVEAMLRNRPAYNGRGSYWWVRGFKESETVPF